MSEISGPIGRIDDVVHQRIRLGLLASLTESPRVDFSFLRGALGVTDGNLSQHLRVLEDAKLITIEKGYDGRRPRTWVRITKQGRAAFTNEIRALQQIVNRAGKNGIV